MTTAWHRTVLVQTGSQAGTRWVLIARRRIHRNAGPVRTRGAPCAAENCGGHALPQLFATINASTIFPIVVVHRSDHCIVRAFCRWIASVAIRSRGSTILQNDGCHVTACTLPRVTSCRLDKCLSHGHHAHHHVGPFAPNSVRHTPSKAESCNYDFVSWRAVSRLEVLDQCCNELHIFRISIWNGRQPSLSAAGPSGTHYQDTRAVCP